MAEPLQEDRIVDIAKDRERYFRTSGKMLLPCPATVEALLKKVPANTLITTELIRQKLAEQFHVEATCPFNTKLCLRAIANDARKNVAYWRVLKQNGELVAYFPGGVEGHAEHLKQEGFTIDTKGKMPKVNKFRESLVHFG